jgi:hypothetical protein
MEQPMYYAYNSLSVYHCEKYGYKYISAIKFNVMWDFKF